MAKAAVKQTGKQKKAATAAAVKAGKIATDVPEGKSKPEGSALVPVIKAGALSPDVGLYAIRSLAEANKTEGEANNLLGQVKNKRKDVLALVTQAIVKAVKADNTIDVSVAFKMEPKLMNVLNAQLGLALGFRTVIKVGNGDDAKERLIYHPAVQEYFPPSGKGVDKTAEDYRMKQTTRTNFLHMLKKCAQAASGIIATKTEMKMDKEAGTLRLSGPAIKEHFGASTVLLDEKKKVGEGKKQIELNEKPSFTAMAAMGAAKAGKVMVAREQSRKNLLAAAGAGPKVDPVVAFVSIMNMAKDAVNKLPDNVTDAQKKAMEAVQNAIEVKLGG